MARSQGGVAGAGQGGGGDQVPLRILHCARARCSDAHVWCARRSRDARSVSEDEVLCTLLGISIWCSRCFKAFENREHEKMGEDDVNILV